VQAFRDYGVDLDGAQITPAFERIRERQIAEAVALALDDLGRLRRNLFGEQAVEFQRTAALAMDLDPEPLRMRLRQAIVADDLPTLLELAAPEHLGELPPGSIWVLSAVLWDRHPEHRPDVYRIYDQALYLYPDDYVLQSIGANVYKQVGRVEAMLACRTAAFSLQPDNPQARYLLADAMLFAGRMVDAVGVFRACVARTPSHAASHNGLGWALILLGDHAGAVASLQKAAELENNPAYHSDLLMARYFAGQASKADLLRTMAITVIPEHQLNYALALVDCPDPERRDPQAAITAVRDPAAEPIYALAGAVIEVIARVRLEDWQGAHAALGKFDTKTEFLVVTPLCLHFLRALIYQKLGQHDAARECHARGLESWAIVVGTDDAAWKRSDVQRWRTAAEQAMGL
jgi:tetratricopeptide (TPR) repeat protein